MLNAERPSYRRDYPGPAIRRKRDQHMSIRHALGRLTAIAAAATGLAALGLTGVASASTGPAAAPAGLRLTADCTIQAFDGHYLSAIGGGGRTTDVIETNRTVASTWET